MVKDPNRKYDIGPPSTKPLERRKGQKKYFFLDDKLYRMIRQERASDLLTAWDYEKNRVVHFILSDAKRRMKNAYDTKEVARLLNRSGVTIQKYVLKEYINPPIEIQSRGKTIRGEPFFTRKWSEADILALHEFLLTHSSGRPRKDGTLGPAPRLPTRKELIAMMRSQPMFYMKTAEGEYVPVWSAYNEV